MKITKRTIPTTHHRRFRTATTLGATILALATTAALADPPEGKGGGKGDNEDNGGSYDESLDEAPVREVDAPINYATTEVLWHNAEQFNDENFQGINVDDINSLGIAVGFAKLAPSPGETYGERRAGITAKVQLTTSGYKLVLDDVSTNQESNRQETNPTIQ